MSMMYPAIRDPNTPPDEKYIRAWFAHLVQIFGVRNGEYRVLRAIFDGTYNGTAIPNTPSQSWSNVEAAHTGRPFRDRMRLVYNVANATVRRYMDSMSAPPTIEGIPEGFTLDEIELADKRAKFLELVWRENDMHVKLLQSSYYQSLLDKAVFNIRPAPHMKCKIKIDLGVPDYFLPITRGDDWQHPLAVIYGFRSYDNAEFLRNPMTFNGDPVFNTVIEYWDPHWFVRLEAKKPPLIIRHDMGFIPWYEVHNLPIPARFRGQGDVDQAIGLNEYLNVLMSSMADMLAYAANPIAVVRGTKVGGVNLPFEPRAVWELERDAQVGFLQWQGAPPSYEAQILRTIQAIEDTTGVSSPAFGREIPSGTSGQAVRSLLAGFNTRIGTKQEMLGNALVKMNRGILSMAEKLFPEQEFRVMGDRVITGPEGTIRRGARQWYTVKPKEFKGWHETRVVFPPTDPASNYFQAVDKFKAGLASKYDTLKAMGVPDVWDHLERIRIERMEEAEHENRMALARNGKLPMSPEQDPHMKALQGLLQQHADKMKGFAPPPGSQGPAAGNGDIPPAAGAFPDATAEKKAKKDVAKAAAKTPEPQATVKGENSPASEQQLEEPDLKINDVMAKLRLAMNLTGRAAVTGELLDKAKSQRGTILLDNLQDANAVRAALGADGARFDFQQIDRFKPLPQNAAVFYDPSKDAQKKNQGVRRARNPIYLNVAVLDTKDTQSARAYQIGVEDNGRMVPLGWTDSKRGFDIDKGEVIRVKVGSISLRRDGDEELYGVGQTVPVKAAPPARPDTIKRVAQLYQEIE